MAAICRILPSFAGSQRILKVWAMRCISMYLLRSSSTLSAAMGNAVRICAPVAFSGLSMSIGPDWVRSRASASPELSLLSSFWGSRDYSGCVYSWLVGSALVLVGAGGGGALVSDVFFPPPSIGVFLVVELRPVRIFYLSTASSFLPRLRFL